MGMGGGVGFVGRVFGGVAARNGAMLTGESISSVAARPTEAAGTIAGDIADRSLGNYMPQLAGHTLKGNPDQRRTYQHDGDRHRRQGQQCGGRQGGCRDSRRNRCGRTVGRNFIGGMGHASYTV